MQGCGVVAQPQDVEVASFPSRQLGQGLNLEPVPLLNYLEDKAKYQGLPEAEPAIPLLSEVLRICTHPCSISLEGLPGQRRNLGWWFVGDRP
jgi:hypothetical protein